MDLIDQKYSFKSIESLKRCKSERGIASTSDGSGCRPSPVKTPENPSVFSELNFCLLYHVGGHGIKYYAGISEIWDSYLFSDPIHKDY